MREKMFYYVWLILLNTVSSVSINAAANYKILFFIVEYYSYFIPTCGVIFNSFILGWYLNWLDLLATMDRVIVTIGVQVSFEYADFFSFDMTPQSRINC